MASPLREPIEGGGYLILGIDLASQAQRIALKQTVI
jgi:hypothetical protein